MADIRNKEKILEAIDQLRRRKARPDIERICNFLVRKYGIDCNDTVSDLQRLVDTEVVIKVEYKGNTSYRNAAKWSKYAMYKKRELRTSAGSTEIHNILSRAFASLLVENPDYLDIGVPRTELERFMLQDDPLTDLTEIELILTKETNSGFLVKLKNGNYSLADHPVPTSPKSTSPSSITSLTEQASDVQLCSSMDSPDKTVEFTSSNPSKEKKSKPEVLPTTVTTPMTTTTTTTINVKATELGAINIGGYRVGVRRKTAKKVFDPSDNYTPTRKRGRPVGGGSNTKKDAQITAGMCCICTNSSNPRKTTTERLIQCRDCSNRAHPSCISGKLSGKEKPLMNHWVCNGCKLCAFCFETSENETMAVCRRCGDCYHMTCHNPPIAEDQWNSKWLCSACKCKKATTSNSTPATPSTPVKTEKSKETQAMEFFERFMPSEETPDPKNWTVNEVCKYLQEHNCVNQAEAFKHHEIDGRSLLLLTRHDVLYELGLKIGPALKVYHFVQLLQTRDIKKVFPFSEMIR